VEAGGSIPTEDEHRSRLVNAVISVSPRPTKPASLQACSMTSSYNEDVGSNLFYFNRSFLLQRHRDGHLLTRVKKGDGFSLQLAGK
jgi:hypothetical protein